MTERSSAGATDGGIGPTGRVMAVDLGSRRIGVATCDSSGALAFPWGVVERSGSEVEDRRRLADVAREVGASLVVVGMPLSLDGRRGRAAVLAGDEAAALASELEGDGVAVVTFDERFTTVSASAALAEAGTRGRKARAVVDSAAATVLLQAWLDRR